MLIFCTLLSLLKIHSVYFVLLFTILNALLIAIFLLTSVFSEIVSVDAEILTRYSCNLVAPLHQDQWWSKC